MTALDLYNRFEIYCKSLRIRRIEEAIAARYKEQKMRCPVHLSIGQEANAVSIAHSLTRKDQMVSTHRGHAHYLAKGGSLDGLIGELYGKSIGCSGGNGGSMHLVDRRRGFLGSTSIVGGTIPIGLGAAFSAKLKGLKTVTAICIGDAAIEEGVFHECANFAGLHQLSVIFFMENNNYSCFTSRNKRQPARENDFRSVADAHGLNFYKMEWAKFYDDHLSLQVQIKNMREYNRGPLLVECDAYRFVEHCGPNTDDNLGYRPEDEVTTWRNLDPIKGLERHLRISGFLDDVTNRKLEDKIQREIDDSFNRVIDSPNPKKEELGAYLYA